MGYYLDKDGNYYEGDQYDPVDRVVVQRPSPDHDYVGEAWVENASRKAKADLVQLDITYALTQRNLRDLVIILAHALKEGTPVDLTGLPGVKNATAVEAQAAALRAQL